MANRDLRIALFIDFENLVTRTGLSPEQFDVQPLLDTLLEKGKVVFRRAYCDWGRFPAAKKNLHEKGVELIDVPPSTRSGKNGADIRLVIDALELAYQREHMDAFAIASGDSDFCPLAYKLRENNRTVIGLGMRDSTSPLFVKACDEFIYVKTDAKKDREEQPPAKSHRRGQQQAKGKDAKAKEAPKEKEPAKQKDGHRRKGGRPAAAVPQIARDQAAAILARATEPVNQSSIADAIQRLQPDFDVRDHGFSTFTRLVEALEHEGVLKREQGAKGQWYVVSPAESDVEDVDLELDGEDAPEQA